MRNRIEVGVAALLSLAYCILTLWAPLLAQQISNSRWGLLPNLFGCIIVFFCGWGLLFRLSWQGQFPRLMSFVFWAFMIEVLVIVGSREVWAYIEKDDLGHYLATCLALVGPLAMTFYVLVLVVQKPKVGRFSKFANSAD
jgi:hypothetical protein